ILARPAKEIIINDVLKALGGALYDIDFCGFHAGLGKLCNNSVDCSARSLWQMIQFTVDDLLNKITLHHLVNPEKEAAGILENILLQTNRGLKLQKNQKVK